MARRALASVLADSGDRVAPGSLGDNDPFVDLGLDSVGGTVLCAALSARMGLDVTPSVLYAAPTLALLATALLALSNGERVFPVRRVVVVGCSSMQDCSVGWEGR